MELNNHYNADIERIVSDQWFGMETRGKGYSAWVEANYLEDAFFQTLKAFVEKPVKSDGELQKEESTTK